MDLVCFSEEWLNRDLTDELVGLDDFTLLRNYRVYGRGGGRLVFLLGIG